MAINANTTTSRPTSACVNSANDVPLALASAAQQSKVLAALDTVKPNPTGATPTHDAYNLAVDQLKRTTIPGKRYVVLITDGQPTQSLGCLGTGIMCNPTPTDPIIASIAQASAESEIQTFVVGAPGSEKSVCTEEDVRSWLSLAARAGNTATPNCSDAAAPFCHYDLSQEADFSTGLANALSSISRAIMSCNYDVPPPPSGQQLDPNKVNMIFTRGANDYVMLLPNGSGTCEKGWSFTDSTNSVVQICGVTCALLQDNPTARLSILFGCKQDTSLTMW
jgi:hypothetical protein